MSPHPAKLLSRSNPEWKKFFARKYRGTASLFAAVPDLPRPDDIELLQYYIHLHPEKRHRKNWVFIIDAIELAISSLAWGEFFKREYKNPRELLDAVPFSSTYSKKMLIHSYLLLQSTNLRKKRFWANSLLAASLEDSSQEWHDFFNREFNSPLELLSAIPKSATQSKSTIVEYYLTLHPVNSIVEYRKWINAVAAFSLAESSAEWHDFFFTSYDNPKEMLEAIPGFSDHSPVTITGYYLALHPVIDKTKLWSNTAAARLFMEKNREAVETVFNKELSHAEVKKKFKLKVSKNTFDTYIYLLRMFDFRP
ncbi:hypothetical protein ACFL57_04810 [Candidatus Margulisiibacteriota bacterium]